VVSGTRVENRDRRRRRRQDSEQEILDAAGRLLRERPFRDLTVDDLMAATSQSRTAFYRHFTDRQDLLIHLQHDLAEELFEMSEGWLGGGEDPVREALEALQRLIGVYQREGPLLRAIAEAASHDDEIEKVYAKLVQRFVDATAARIERDVAAGRAAVSDPRQAATALCWMTERYLTACFGHPGGGDPDASVATLHMIWMRALYGRLPEEFPPPGTVG